MKKSFNPILAQLATTYKAASAEIESVNPFLATIIEETRIAFSKHRGFFGYHEAKAMFRGFKATDAINRIHNLSDFDKNPQLFWELCEYFKKEQKDGIGTRGLSAVRLFYHELNKRNIFTKKFAMADKSPIEHLKRGNLSKFLKEEFVCTKDTFLIKYEKKALPYLLSLNYKSEVLKQATLLAIENTRRKSERCKDDMVIAKESESWFEDSENIKTYKDLTIQRFINAMEVVKKRYSGKRLKKAMNFLFDMYSVMIRKYPNYNFFHDSYLWNSQMILDQRVPIQICNGYQIVFMGRESNLPGYEKILFCANNADRLSANGHRFGMHACDLSGVKTEYYRMILVNFGSSYFSNNVDRAATFFKWLEKYKTHKKCEDNRIKHISTDEMMAYRAYITRKLKEAESRNRLIGGAKKIILWATSMNYIDLEIGALNDFTLFKTIYRPNSRCLTKCEIETLIETLEELGKTDIRCLLALHILIIQLFVDTRAGEICAISLKRLRFNSDGTSKYVSMEKNAGKEMVKIRYSKSATKVILEAIEATQEIRAKCPIDGPKDSLFLYDAGETWAHNFKVMITDTYNNALAKACEYAHLQKITSGHIRDTYMTTVARFAHKNNLTELQKAILTRHATKVSTSRYIDINLDSFLRASDGIKLGNIKN